MEMFVWSPKNGSLLPKIGPNEKENLTVLYSVNAAGDIATPLAMWAYDWVPGYITAKQPHNWKYGKSEKGWMTLEIFYEFIANSFYQYLIE